MTFHADIRTTIYTFRGPKEKETVALCVSVLFFLSFFLSVIHSLFFFCVEVCKMLHASELLILLLLLAVNYSFLLLSGFGRLFSDE